MGPPQVSESKRKREEILERAKAKIASSQQKAREKVKKRRNSIRDKIRKNISSGCLQFSSGTNQKPSSSGKHPSSNLKKAHGPDGTNVTLGVKSTGEKSTNIKMKCEESASLKRKDGKEKVATTSHLKIQFISSAELPKVQPYNSSRKSSFPLRKHQDNELGYKGRQSHRHVHQKRREKEYFAYKNGKEYHSSSSDWESD